MSFKKQIIKEIEEMIDDVNAQNEIIEANFKSILGRFSAIEKFLGIQYVEEKNEFKGYKKIVTNNK